MIINGYWGEVSDDESLIIDSCGHIFTFQGREINRPKGRPNYLLLYIYHGEAKFFFGSKEVICSDGDYVLYAPGEPQHHIYDSNISGEFYYVHFTTKDHTITDLLEMKSSIPYHSNSSAEIADIFEELLTELQSKEKNYKRLAINILTELFIKINRRISVSEHVIPSTEINTVIQFINKHYMQNHSLEDYADMCNLSKYHFLREFKKQTQISPLKYRANLRIRHAKDRLLMTNDSIKRISEELGYSSPEYFSETFKNATGLSPQAYRVR